MHACLKDRQVLCAAVGDDSETDQSFCNVPANDNATHALFLAGFDA